MKIWDTIDLSDMEKDQVYVYVDSEFSGLLRVKDFMYDHVLRYPVVQFELVRVLNGTSSQPVGHEMMFCQDELNQMNLKLAQLRGQVL